MQGQSYCCPVYGPGLPGTCMPDMRALEAGIDKGRGSVGPVTEGNKTTEYRYHLNTDTTHYNQSLTGMCSEHEPDAGSHRIPEVHMWPDLGRTTRIYSGV